MEDFIQEVEAYAAACGVLPATVVQWADCGNGQTWKKWLESRGPSLRTADKIREYIASNPADNGKAKKMHATAFGGKAASVQGGAS